MKKMANGKNNHTSTDRAEKPITRTSSDWEYIANLLRQQSKSGSIDSIEEFYLNLDIPKQTFYDNIKKQQCMKEAHAYALEQIGVNNEKHCKKNNLSMTSVVGGSLHHYLGRWKDDLEYKAELKAKHTPQGQISGNFTIVQEPIVETKEVDKQLKKKVKE